MVEFEAARVWVSTGACNFPSSLFVRSSVGSGGGGQLVEKEQSWSEFPLDWY